MADETARRRTRVAISAVYDIDMPDNEPVGDVEDILSNENESSK